MARKGTESAERGDRAPVVGSYLHQIEPPGCGTAVQLGRGMIAEEIDEPVPAWFDESGDLLACILPPGSLPLSLDFAPGVLGEVARGTPTGRFVGPLIGLSPKRAADAARDLLPDLLDEALQRPKPPMRPPTSDMPADGVRITRMIGDPPAAATMIAEGPAPLRRMLRVWLCVELLRRNKETIKVTDAFSQVGEMVGMDESNVSKLYYRTRKDMRPK